MDYKSCSTQNYPTILYLQKYRLARKFKVDYGFSLLIIIMTALNEGEAGYPFMKAIKFPSSDYFDSEEEPLEVLDNLSRINIFVGANNSGKSRMMREILKTNPLQYKINEEMYDEKYRNKLNINGLFEHIPIILNDTDTRSRINLPLKNNLEDIQKCITKKGLYSNNLQSLIYNSVHNLQSIKQSLNKNIPSLNIVIDILETIKSRGIENYIINHSNKVYIPILRSLTSFFPYFNALPPSIRNKVVPSDFGHLNNHFSIDQIFNVQLLFISVVASQYGSPGEIFTGQNLYEEIQQMLLGKAKERQKIKEFEEFLSKNFFNGKSVTLTPIKESVETSENWNCLHVNIGDTVDRKIYDLGDGIQSMIILTFPLFKYERALICIEEPEQNLHPGMQRKLLNVLQDESQKRGHQIFLTTHSNHLLDLSIGEDDISVYQFREKETTGQFIVEEKKSGENSLLEELGVQNSSVFLANKTIWVEGITDEKYLSRFLELHSKNLSEGEKRISEDIDFSFIHYGGANLTNFNPTGRERLCGKGIIISDNDNGKNKELKTKLEGEGAKLETIPVREIENLLNPKNIRNAIVNYYSKTNKKDKCPELLQQLETKIFPDSLESDYQNSDQYLGKYIDKKLATIKQEFDLKTFKGKSGTISDKHYFCDMALKDMDNWEDLSKKAQDLTKNIYDFIVE